tara:strand:- start:86 stop:373 length:288 start_codon:yes stop_codon:yes gene_type:complete
MLTKEQKEELVKMEEWKIILKEDEMAFGDFKEMDRRHERQVEVRRIRNEFSHGQGFKGSEKELLSAIRQKNKMLGGTKTLDELERRLLKVLKEDD